MDFPKIYDRMDTVLKNILRVTADLVEDFV